MRILVSKAAKVGTKDGGVNPMPRLFNITNHAITDEQRSDAVSSLGIDEVVETPPDVARCWGTVPPELDSVSGYVQPVIDWLESQSMQFNDVVWVQGEWGAVFAVVEWCCQNCIRCVYATTKRYAEEVETDKGIQIMHLFKHVRFRDFPSISI